MTRTPNPPPWKIEALSPAARQAVETQGIDGAFDLKPLMKLFKELQLWDEQVEVRKKRAGRILGFAIAGMITGVFFSCIAATEFDNGLAAVAMIAVPVAALVYAIRNKGALRSVDIPNEVRVSIQPFLQTIVQDIDPETKIKVQLDLSGRVDAKKKGERSMAHHRYISLKETHFVDPFCHIRIPLRDGSEAVLHFENEYFRYDRQSRGSRGKIKSKRKWKKYCFIQGSLTPASPCEWDQRRILPMGPNETLNFVEKNGVTVARLSRHYKFKEAGIEPEIAVPASEVISLFVRLAAMRGKSGGQKK